MFNKVTDPAKIVTDLVLLSVLAKQRVDKDYVELSQDYAPAYVNGVKVKGQSPYAKFYRDLQSNKRFMVVSGLPMVDADGVPLDCQWVQNGQVYQEKSNLFHITVHDLNGKIKIQVKNDQPNGVKANQQLVYIPQLFLAGVEIKEPIPVLLAVDPLNSNYVNNTLVWDYGICKRYLRLIEGSVLGRWEFALNPVGEVRIKYNQVGDFKLRLGQFKISDDEEMVKSTDFDELAKLSGYPVTISDSATFYPDADPETSSVDGYVGRDVAQSTWASLRGGVGNYVFDANINCTVFFYSDTNYTWYDLIREVLIFNTAGLPDNATITSATLSIYGVAKVDDIGIAPDINVYSSNPASNTGLVAADYNIALWGATAFSTAITYANWLVASPFWNDFVLNSSGLAAISKTSVTKLGLRNANYDVANVEPTKNIAQLLSQLLGYASEQGNGYQPKLVVTYTIPEKASPNMAAKLVAAGVL